MYKFIDCTRRYLARRSGTQRLLAFALGGGGGGTNHDEELGHQLRVHELRDGRDLWNPRPVALEPEDENKFGGHVRSGCFHGRLDETSASAIVRGNGGEGGGART